MGAVTVAPGSLTRLACVFAIGSLVASHQAMAFPATDAASPSVTSDVAPPTESDMRHQLQLHAMAS